jgi:hypothetical protein
MKKISKKEQQELGIRLLTRKLAHKDVAVMNVNKRIGKIDIVDDERVFVDFSGGYGVYYLNKKDEDYEPLYYFLSAD